MELVVITFLLFGVAFIAYAYGAWKLSRYAARISGGLAMGVLLFPPLTFHFAFNKLDQEGKELPITMWMFGLVTAILLTFVFWTPISYTLTGRIDELEPPSGVAEAAVAEHGSPEFKKDADKKSESDSE